MTFSSEFSALYACARGGDPVAFEALVHLYRPALVRFIDQRIGQGSRGRIVADDVLQETLLTFFERLGSFPDDLGQSELKAYVLQIAKRRIVDLWRRSGRETGDLTQAPEPVGHMSRTGPVTKSDDRRKLRDLIDGLPPAYAKVIWCCVFEGKSTAQAAESLGLSRANVKQRLFRGRAMLREAWNPG